MLANRVRMSSNKKQKEELEPFYYVGSVMSDSDWTIAYNSDGSPDSTPLFIANNKTPFYFEIVLDTPTESSGYFNLNLTGLNGYFARVLSLTQYPAGTSVISGNYSTADLTSSGLYRNRKNDGTFLRLRVDYLDNNPSGEVTFYADSSKGTKIGGWEFGRG